ncbi:hypothetical protein GA0115236_125510 [Streptomyces sp. IgraMP-1]|nr:hypothetical protein GA0115236_125510 [Streptomyces sp. IgraMP-1]
MVCGDGPGAAKADKRRGARVQHAPHLLTGRNLRAIRDSWQFPSGAARRGGTGSAHPPGAPPTGRSARAPPIPRHLPPRRARGGRGSRRRGHRQHLGLRRRRPPGRGERRPAGRAQTHPRAAAEAALPDEPGGEGRPALRDAGLRPHRDRPGPGGRRRQPQGAGRPRRRRADLDVPRRRHHLLHLGAQHPRPAPDRRAVQRHPARLAGAEKRFAGAHLHRPGARHRLPGRRSGHPAAGGDGAGRGREPHRHPAGRAHRRGRAGRPRHPPELRAGRRRQRQPGQPGDRRPLLQLRPAGGGRPGGRTGEGGTRGPGSPPAPSTSRATATPPPTATRRCRPSTTPARSGSGWTRRRSGRRSRRASTRS